MPHVFQPASGAAPATDQRQEKRRRSRAEAELTPEEKLLNAIFPERQGPYLVEVEDEATQKFVQQLVDALQGSKASSFAALSEQHIEALVPIFAGKDPIANSRRSMEMDNAKLRAEFVTRHDCFTAAELSDIAGHAAKNRSVTASRWKSQGRIFSVSFQGNELYPAFQFRDGEPRPVISSVLSALPDTMTAWQRAFWFTSPNGWLSGDRPADRLDDSLPVIDAAVRESDPVG